MPPCEGGLSQSAYTSHFAWKCLRMPQEDVAEEDYIVAWFPNSAPVGYGIDFLHINRFLSLNFETFARIIV